LNLKNTLESSLPIGRELLERSQILAHRSIALTILIALTLFILTLAEQGEAGVSSMPGDSRPVLGELDLRSPTGEQVSLIPFIGRKVVVVVFWATWCPICLKEVPHLNQLNSNTLVKVIGVNEGESIKEIRKFVSDHKVEYDIVLDPKAAVAKSFGVPGMPYCVIISRSGVIAYRGPGLPEDLDTYLRE
jgi:peroxiredoxin